MRAALATSPDELAVKTSRTRAASAVSAFADDRSRAGYLAAYGTCWGIAQTLGPLASTRLLSTGVPAAWLTGAALCVLLAALVPFAGKAVTMAERPSRLRAGWRS